jgi:hypothetical protein
MNSKALTFAALLLLSTTQAQADSIEGSWSITGFKGEAWFVNPQELIGKTQEFEGGSAAGPLYSCNFAGQSMTYTTYTNEEFFKNPEFELFRAVSEGLTLSSSNVFVHRITCDGQEDTSARRVLYPIVTNEARASAWYLYEGGIVELSRP